MKEHKKDVFSGVLMGFEARRSRVTTVRTSRIVVDPPQYCWAIAHIVAKHIICQRQLHLRQSLIIVHLCCERLRCSRFTRNDVACSTQTMLCLMAQMKKSNYLKLDFWVAGG